MKERINVPGTAQVTTRAGYAGPSLAITMRSDGSDAPTHSQILSQR
jgi:hypothetical protein